MKPVIHPYLVSVVGKTHGADFRIGETRLPDLGQAAGHDRDGKMAIERGASLAMADDHHVDIVRCNEPKPYLIIRRIEIGTGELATPPEAFIAGPPRSSPQPGF